MLVQKAFWWAYSILEELIFRGAYHWNNFCISKWVGVVNRNSSKHKDNSLKQLKTANPNSLWASI